MSLGSLVLLTPLPSRSAVSLFRFIFIYLSFSFWTCITGSLLLLDIVLVRRVVELEDDEDICYLMELSF